MANLPEIIKRGVSFMVMLGGYLSSDGSNASAVIIKDIGVIGQSRNRDRAAVGAVIQKVTWAVGDNVRETTITVLTTNAVAPNGSEALLFCVNPGTDAIAAAWLTETDLEDTDVQYELIRANGNERTYQFTGPLMALAMKLTGGSDTALRVFIGAK